MAVVFSVAFMVKHRPSITHVAAKEGPLNTSSKRTPEGKSSANDDEISPAVKAYIAKMKSDARRIGEDYQREIEPRAARFRRFQDPVLLAGPKETVEVLRKAGLAYMRTDAFAERQTQYFENDDFNVACFFENTKITKFSVGATGPNKVSKMLDGIRTCQLHGLISITDSEWRVVKEALEVLIATGKRKGFVLGERTCWFHIMAGQNLINVNTDTVDFEIEWPD